MYFRYIVFEDFSQIIFATILFEICNNNVQFYSIEISSLSILFTIIISSISEFEYFFRFEILSVIFDISKLQSASKETKKIDTFLEKNSKSNKRIYIKSIF